MIKPDVILKILESRRERVKLLLAGFRNIAVHRYLTVGPAWVYAHLEYGLDDFERFVHICEYLQREGYIQ